MAYEVIEKTLISSKPKRKRALQSCNRLLKSVAVSQCVSIWFLYSFSSDFHVSFFKIFLLILSIYCTAFSFHFDLIFVQFPIDRACVPVSECVQRSRQMFRRNVCFDFHSAVHEKWRCIGIVMACCFTDFLWFFFDSSLYFSVSLSPRLSLSLSLSLYLSIYLSIHLSLYLLRFLFPHIVS